ncbi:unnamed protein product [Urochloa humidicola]
MFFACTPGVTSAVNQQGSDMSIFKSSRWHGISTALSAAAAESVAAALHQLGGKRSSRAPAQPLARDADGGESVPCPRDGKEPTLPPNHPETIRVRRIAANIIAAACDDRTYDAGPRRGLLQRIRRPFDGIDWRVEVFDSEYIDAYSFGDGQIRMSTALIGYTGKDADIADTIGHEARWHVIARHSWKAWRNMFWASFLANFAAGLLDVPRDDDDRPWEPLFMRPCYFRQEFEADRLGLLLVAAAGYDPREVPARYRNFGLMYGPSLPSVHDTHPEDETRAQALSQAKVMDEALELYRRAVRSGKGTEGLDSWKSTLHYALSWWQYWTDKWLLRDLLRITFLQIRAHLLGQKQPHIN